MPLRQIIYHNLLEFIRDIQLLLGFSIACLVLKNLKKSANSLLSENQTRARIFEFSEQTTEPIFLKFFIYIELGKTEQKVTGCY